MTTLPELYLPPVEPSVRADPLEWKQFADNLAANIAEYVNNVFTDVWDTAMGRMEVSRIDSTPCETQHVWDPVAEQFLKDLRIPTELKVPVPVVKNWDCPYTPTVCPVGDGVPESVSLMTYQYPNSVAISWCGEHGNQMTRFAKEAEGDIIVSWEGQKEIRIWDYHNPEDAYYEYTSAYDGDVGVTVEKTSDTYPWEDPNTEFHHSMLQLVPSVIGGGQQIVSSCEFGLQEQHYSPNDSGEWVRTFHKYQGYDHVAKDVVIPNHSLAKEANSPATSSERLTQLVYAGDACVSTLAAHNPNCPETVKVEHLLTHN